MTRYHSGAFFGKTQLRKLLHKQWNPRIERLEDRRVLAAAIGDMALSSAGSLEVTGGYETVDVADIPTRLTRDNNVGTELDFYDASEFGVERSVIPGELVIGLRREFGFSPAEEQHTFLMDLNNTFAGANIDFEADSLLTLSNEGIDVVHLNFDDAHAVEVLAEELEQRSDIVWAQPNYQYTGDIYDLNPNDPLFGSQYHHPLMGNTTAWDTTLGDSSVIIAVTDDGVQLNHPDLAQNIWVNQAEANGAAGVDDDNNGFIDDLNGWDFVAGDNDPNPQVAANDHGTHVAGIAAAITNNANQVAGVAGNSTIMPIRIAGSDGGFTSTIMASTFAYAIDNGARIANTSYNIDGFVGDATFTAGLQYYYDNGGLHFNSAGNASSLNPPRQVFEQTLLVASTDQNDALSGFSNYGTGIDVSAPGSAILSTVTNGGTGTKGGTSMAAPNAAGVAALIWAANPGYTRDQVAATLLATADNIDGNNAGFAGFLGAGRVNSAQALSTSVPAPKLVSSEGLPDHGAVIDQSTLIDSITLIPDQPLDPTTVAASSFELRSAGANGSFGDGDDIIYALAVSDYLIGSNSIQLDITAAPLEIGSYRFTASGLENPFGTDLDGNGDGTGGDDFVREFVIELRDPQPIGPPGSLIFDPPVFGSVSAAGQVDSYSYDLESGQTMTIVANSGNSLQMQVEILDAASNQIAIASAVAPGESLLLQSIPKTTAGEITVNISGLSGTTGAYDYELFLNAAVNAEVIGGAPNDTAAAAQDINSSFLDLGTGTASRGAVVGRPSLAMSESFESGSLGGQWTTSSSEATGRIQVTDQFGAADGSFALLMDVSPSGPNNLNEAIWTVDLAGIASPTLSFFHNDYADEETALPATFTGSANGDGVAISADGVNWHTVLNATNVNTWTLVEIDLAAAAANAGITLGSNFQIKFQQYDNFPLATDGRGYDAIAISGGVDWYSFELDDGQSASVVATDPANETSFELYHNDPINGPVLIGSSAAGDLLSATIDRYVDQTSNGAADEYLVRIEGADQYELIVTIDSDFEQEANNDLSDAQLSNSALGFVNSTALADTSVLRDFPGIDANSSFCGCQPPDTHAAAGPNHIVEVVNTAIAMFDKTGNVLSAAQAFTTFFRSDIVAGDTFTFDPVVAYMEDVGRWVVGVLSGAVAGASETDLLVAVSDTSDPLGGWTEQHRIDFAGVSPGLFADYPKIGWNADSVIFTLNMFGGSFVDVNIVAIDKATVVDNNASTITSFISERPGSSFTMAAATMHGSAPGAPMWFVEENGFGGTKTSIRAVKMDNVLTASPTYTDYLIPVSTYVSGASPAAPQPGGSRRTNDARILNSEWRDNRLVATHSANVGGETKVRWYELDTAPSTPTLAQEGLIDPGPGIATYFPSIAINSAGDIGLTYMQSSSTEFTSMYVTGQVAGGAPGTTGTPRLAKGGDEFYPGNRSGDYSGITVDPVTDTFWAANEVSLSGNPNPLWSTHIAEFAVAPIEDADYYEVQVNSGDSLTIQTFTPFDGPGIPDNTLDPNLELFAPDGTSLASDDNSAGDGKNSLLTHAATLTGTYFVKVSGTNQSAGEYFFEVLGASGSDPGPAVVDVDPDDGSTVNAFPTSVTLDFSETILASSVQPGDVLIGGRAALSVTPVDGDTFVFEVDPAANTGDATYTISMAAGAINDLQGQLLGSDFSSTFILDTTGPQILSTVWNGAALPANRAMPEGTLRFEALFTERLFTLRSARTGLKAPGTEDVLLLNTLTNVSVNPDRVEFDPNTLNFSAEFDGLDEGVYELRLVSGDGAFEDQVGNDLDGEPNGAAADGTVTGNGTAGGDYTVQFFVDSVSRPSNVFDALQPAGGLVSHSTNNLTVLHDPADVDELTFFAQAGETLTAIATPGQAASVTASIPGQTGDFTSATPGASVVIPITALPSTGEYAVRLSADALTDVNLQIVRNAMLELQVGDTFEGQTASLNPSFIDLGSGRYSVIGQSTPSVVDTELLTNGGFEGGAFAPWVPVANGQGEFLTWRVAGAGQGFFNSSDPLSGNFSAMNGFDGEIGLEYQLYQQVTIPDTPSAVLTTNHRIQYQDLGAPATLPRDFEISIRDVNNNLLQMLYVENVNIAGAPYTDLGWNQQVFDVTQFAGQTVRVHFREFIPESSTGPALLQYDDISLIAKVPTGPDADVYTLDLTGKVGEQIDIAFAGHGNSENGTRVEVYDAEDNFLGQASNDPFFNGSQLANYDLGFLDFQVPADGIYTIRVDRTQTSDYTLVVTEDLVFDSEDNDQQNSPFVRDLGGRGAIGHATHSAGGLNLVASRSEFDVLAPGLPIEDFEDGTVPAGGVTVCTGPFDSTTNNACFNPGDILPGVAAQDNPGPDTNGMVILGPGFASVGNSSVVAGAASFADGTNILFPNDDVTAFGMDVLINVAGTVGYTVRGIGNNVLATGDINVAPNSSTFLGYVGDQVITSVSLSSPSGELVDNVAFGTVLPDVDVYRDNLAAGQTISYSVQSLLDDEHHSPLNDLDPEIRVIHPDGTTIVAADQDSLDGRGAFVKFTAPVAGDYTLIVLPESGEGNYLLKEEVDTIAPRITDVIVASSAWSPAFIDLVDGGGAGAGNGLGLSLPGPGQMRNLPWISGIDRFYIQFSEYVAADFVAGNVSLLGSNIADYKPNLSLQYGVHGTNMGTLQLSAPVTNDTLLLTVFDLLADPSGNPLDGEWSDNSSTVSGDGTVGGQFNFRIDILAGDVDDSGAVNFSGDLFAVLGQNGLVPSNLAEAYFDVTSDGVVNFSGDLFEVLALNGSVLPNDPPDPPPPPNNRSRGDNWGGGNTGEGEGFFDDRESLTDSLFADWNDDLLGDDFGIGI